jgi:hypothetical protein
VIVVDPREYTPPAWRAGAAAACDARAREHMSAPVVSRG